MPNAVYARAFHSVFLHRLGILANSVEWLRRRSPGTYKKHKDVKLLLAVWKVIAESLAEPASPRYFLGNTLGSEHRHWRRCKEGLPPRYRLFFQFSSERLICIYAWLNDEKTLRKEGARTDVYAAFRRLLERGVIPSGFVDLLRQSTFWDAAEAFLKTIPPA